MSTPDLYPAAMRERFDAVVKALPVGTLLDFHGIESVVTGHQMLPASESVFLPHMSRSVDNSGGDKFVLHLANRNHDTVYHGTVLPVVETLELAEGAVLRTPAEWEAIDGVRVVDPDGWRGDLRLPGGLEYGPKEWTEPIVRDEWDHRMAHSTVDHASRPRSTRIPTMAVRESDESAEAVLSVVDNGDSAFFETVVESTGTTGVAHYSRAALGVSDPAELLRFGATVTAMAEALKSRKEAGL